MVDFVGLIVGVILYCIGEFDLQMMWQVDLVFGFQEVGYVVFIGLIVDMNDSFVGVFDVVWVDGQVGGLLVNFVDIDVLFLGLVFEVFQIFFDSVLV